MRVGGAGRIGGGGVRGVNWLVFEVTSLCLAGVGWRYGFAFAVILLDILIV